MLEVTGVSKHYDMEHGAVPVLTDATFRVEAGESVAITGESGSGKSTLLHILAALMPPDEGAISVAGTPLAALNERAADRYRRETLGMVFQKFNLIDCLCARDNICFPARLVGNVDEAYITQLTEELGLAALLSKLPQDLSGGEQQRVAIARALAHRPKLLLADEPTGNLDDRNSDVVSKLLFSLAKQHDIALVMVTHSRALAAQADRQLHLKDGCLTAP